MTAKSPCTHTHTPRHPHPRPLTPSILLTSPFPISHNPQPSCRSLSKSGLLTCPSATNTGYTFSPVVVTTHTHTYPCAADNLLKLALYPNDSTRTHTRPHVRRRAHADDWCGAGVPGIPGAIGSQALDKLSLGDRGGARCVFGGDPVTASEKRAWVMVAGGYEL